MEWLWNRLVAGLLLVLLAPLFVVVAVAIKVDSRGPVFFRQARVGSRRVRAGDEVSWESRVIGVLKFRSMVDGVDDRPHVEHVQRYVAGDLAAGDEGFKLAGDERITPVGRVIRRLSLDELPQLVNVLVGHMNIVGPRPVPVYEVENYELAHFERLHALPGITGFWQVRGRGRVTFDEMVAMDIWYTRNRDFWLDVRLMLETIPAVLRMRGAA